MFFIWFHVIFMIWKMSPYMKWSVTLQLQELIIDGKPNGVANHSVSGGGVTLFSLLVLTNGGKLYWYLPAQWLWWERDALTTGLSLHSRVWVPLTLYTSSPWIISLFIHMIESMLYNNLNKKTGNWEQHFTTEAFMLVVFNFSMVIWCCIWTLSFFSSFLIVVNCKKLSGFFDLLETSVVYLQ